MVKAVLLTTEQSIIELTDALRGSVNIDFIDMRTVRAVDAEIAYADAEATGAELAVVYGLKAPEPLPRRKRIPTAYIGYSLFDLAGIKNRAAGEDGNKKAAFILHDDMLCRSVDTEQVEGYGIHIVEVDAYGSVERAAEAAVNAGVEILIGGSAVALCADELGVEYYLSKPGRDSVYTSLTLAELRCERIMAEKLSKARSTAIMTGTFGGIVTVDSRGNIIEMSPRASFLMNCRGKTVAGMYVLNVFPSLEKEVLDTALVGREPVFNYITGSRDRHHLVNIEPVIVDGELCGAVLAVKKWVERQQAAPAEHDDADTGANRRFSDFTFRSDQFRSLIARAKLASYTDAPIMLYGEDGTETTSIAQAIHNESLRSRQGFVEVECDAWEPARLNELLFGAMKKPDDETSAKCILEIAEGGTLFLNHIDELPKELQFRVCRLIMGQYSLNSSLRQLAADVRVIAATNKNLRHMMNTGEFRSDLYYALNVISLEIPPLRERKEDIDDIVNRYMERYAAIYTKPAYLIKGAYDCIREFGWQGNTRQLENFIKKLILTTPHRNISEAFVRQALREMEQREVTRHEPLKKLGAVPVEGEAAVIMEALRRNNGSKTKTAEELGISKATLWRRMQKYGITTDYTV